MVVGLANNWLAMRKKTYKGHTIADLNNAHIDRVNVIGKRMLFNSDCNNTI